MPKRAELKELKREMSRTFSGKKLVFGSGNFDAKIVFVGEAPGREEEKQGKPFVGRAGKLLDAALDNAGIRRGNVYITNVVKFRPTKDGKNRAPSGKEIKLFAPFLMKELEIIKPRIICALGATALNALAGRREITKSRGKIITAHDFRILPAFHPAAVLRNPARKNVFFRDIARLGTT